MVRILGGVLKVMSSSLGEGGLRGHRGFGRRACKCKLIGDTLDKKGANLVLRHAPRKEEPYKVLEENHGACGGHFALKITLHRILQEGYIWPSI